MYERLLNKTTAPDEGAIAATLGQAALALLNALEHELSSRYDLRRELRFPFGKGYGWGYKYAHRSRHLCYAFFEQGAFTVTLQLGDEAVDAVEELLPALTPAIAALWANRYPCGERGGWIHARVTDTTALADIIALLAVKLPPRFPR